MKKQDLALALKKELSAMLLLSKQSDKISADIKRLSDYIWDLESELAELRGRRDTPTPIKFQIDPWGWTPTRAHADDAGWDLKATPYIEHENDRYIVDTGVHVLLPSGYTALILPRSSMSVIGANIATGVIDAGYTGSIKVVLSMPSGHLICSGDRIAQMVILPLPAVELVAGDVIGAVSERGAQGFGSTGK